MEERKSYYPIFAGLTGRLCLVVGGGRVAQRKVAALLRHGSEVVVVSPRVTSWIDQKAKEEKIRCRTRRFRSSDLNGVWLAFAATNDPSVNQRVFKEAERRRIFANVADKRSLCSFISPSQLRRGAVSIAISTGGMSPALGKLLREKFERAVGPEYGQMASFLYSLRPIARRRLPGQCDRKIFFNRLASERFLWLARAGKRAEMRREALRLLDRLAGKKPSHASR